MKIFALLTIVGAMTLAMTVIFGFEEPNALLLLLSSILMFAGPVAMFAHVALTAELTREEKRIWIRALTGRHAPAAWSLYLTCDDRREAIGHLPPSQPVPD